MLFFSVPLGIDQEDADSSTVSSQVTQPAKAEECQSIISSDSFLKQDFCNLIGLL